MGILPSCPLGTSRCGSSLRPPSSSPACSCLWMDVGRIVPTYCYWLTCVSIVQAYTNIYISIYTWTPCLRRALLTHRGGRVTVLSPCCLLPAALLLWLLLCDVCVRACGRHVCIKKGWRLMENRGRAFNSDNNTTDLSIHPSIHSNAVHCICQVYLYIHCNS